MISPVIIALPPRKVDLYTGALGGAFLLSGSHLYKDSARGYPLFGTLKKDTVLPGAEASGEGKTRYEIVQEQLRREKEDREHGARAGAQPRKEEGVKKALEQIWMGDEGPDWKQKRLAEEREKLAEGKGYSGLITDQIWEVWNRNNPKTDEDKDGDSGASEKEAER